MEIEGEGKNQASGCFEDLIPTSKPKIKDIQVPSPVA